MAGLPTARTLGWYSSRASARATRSRPSSISMRTRTVPAGVVTVPTSTRSSISGTTAGCAWAPAAATLSSRSGERFGSGMVRPSRQRACLRHALWRRLLRCFAAFLGNPRRMEIAWWSAVAGLLLLVMALSDSLLARLPLSTSMLYLAVGVAVSPLWLDWLQVTATSHARALERIAEVVLLLSLFGSGLKMSVGLSDGRWLLPLRLAVVSMLVTVALIAGAGVLWLGLPLGAAILLGGILAPTDPVLASDVQVAEPTDRDRLRFALTGEAGLNDGTAFPFVLLGLGLLGLHDLGNSLWRWLAIAVLWGVAVGIGVGALLGTLVGRFVLYLRRTHKEAVCLDNVLALGLIGMAYGLASLAHGYGFLAVFAAGVALRRIEQRASAGAKASESSASS